MKHELQSKHQRVNELQAELQRLSLAKERRADKIKAQWESRRRDLVEEQRVSMAKQQEFVDRVSADVRALRDKLQALDERIASARAAKQRALDMAEDEGRRKISRAKRQWEQDEKGHFDKIAARFVW